ncbi:unnamed protein product [Rotaria socialis]|uniref:DDE Tnp4 domain-containing protein n=1 Tax=Rotaria socialis TaxID=392032 RepID=A0A821LDE0_9BILA|nr:unnamed protein product [Rotaria socialis]
MKPQYVRFVMSPNNNVQPQNSHYLKLNSVHKVLHQNNVVSSLQILNGINPPATATLPTRLIINSSPKTFTLSSPITPQTINKSTAGITILEQVPNSSSVVDIPIARSTTAESPLSAETPPKAAKRSRNWSEGETLSFIRIWSDFQLQLNKGGQRNTPIYNQMAKELNSILKDRQLSGADVKCKISNLTIEYRKKKKEQGKTGGSPSSWSYFDAIDKILGERPYNDDTLLSDSMVTEQTELIDIENTQSCDLNATQISEQVNEDIDMLKDEEAPGSDPNRLNKSSSPSHDKSTIKSEAKGTPNTTKRTNAVRKKRASEIKLDLMQELLGKINDANEVASRSEVKMDKTSCLALVHTYLSKQQRLTNDISNLRSEYQRLLRKYRRNLNQRNKLIAILIMLNENSFGINHRDNHQEIKDTSSKFLRKFGYPMCIGAVDGTHISIKPPLGLEADYFNYKKYHSVIMLAVVNADLGFTYINVGAPGRCNDASVYSRSNLSDVIKNSIYEDHYMTVNNTKIQSHLIADSAFALDQTLLEPFPDRIDMPRQHRMFNYRLSRCRSTVERAFGMMKNRFRILHKKMEFNLDNTINIIKTAVIMHNICILHGDVEDILWHQPYPVHKKPSCPITTTNGIGVREAMIQYFEQNPL